jgi:hypothetical protein
MANWIEINSFNVMAVRYNPSNKVFDVKFQNGIIYRYFNVTEEDFREFMYSNSKGRFIKQLGRFRKYERVGHAFKQ